jgi:hypothetical protein
MNQTKSNPAQIASAIIAFFGFVAVIIQVALISKNFSAAAARQVYMSYSEAALRNPKFVEPDLDALKSEPVEYVKYKSYVAHMLFAYDEILSVYDQPEWRRSFDSDIKYHMRYVCTDMLRSDDDTYFSKMRKLLARTREHCADAVKNP